MKKISPETHEKLENLLDQARQINSVYEQQMDEILDQVNEITGETTANGHGFDAVYNGVSSRNILAKLNIEVDVN